MYPDIGSVLCYPEGVTTVCGALSCLLLQTDNSPGLRATDQKRTWYVDALLSCPLPYGELVSLVR